MPSLWLWVEFSGHCLYTHRAALKFVHSTLCGMIDRQSDSIMWYDKIDRQSDSIIENNKQRRQPIKFLQESQSVCLKTYTIHLIHLGLDVKFINLVSCKDFFVVFNTTIMMYFKCILLCLKI